MKKNSRNYNWRKKLKKKNRTSIKEIKYEIRNSKNERLKLTNNKQIRQLCTLVIRREKRKEKHKKMIIDGNLTIISLHALHHMKEDTIMYLGRWWIIRFDHWWRRHTRHLNGTDIAHLLVCLKHAPTTFWLKEIKSEYTKTPSWSS